MIIVEFLSPAGAGKTTLSRDLLKHSKPRIFSQDLAWLLAYLPYWLVVFLRYCSHRSVFLFRLQAKVFSCLLKKELVYFRKHLVGRDVAQSAQTYFQECAGLFSKEMGGGDAASRIGFFMNSVVKYNLAKQIKSNDIAVFDEGLAQRGTSLAYQGADDDVLTDYFQNTPMPDLLIVLDIDFGVGISRLKDRLGLKKEHLNKYKEAIASVSMGESIYKSRGCSIIKLNADDPIDDNVNLILKKFSEMQGGG